MPESGKEEKDGCNRHAAGRETLPRQDQYKQRTHAEKTASEEENFFALKGIGLAVLLFAALFPIYWLALMAIRPTAETSMGAGLIPHQITGEHFTELFVARR